MVFRIVLTDFPSMSFHAADGGVVMTVVYVCIYTLMIIDDDNFIKNYLLVLIYKVHFGCGIWDWFDWFYEYVIPCGCWWHHHDSGVCMHLYWCSLMMTTSEFRFSLAIKGLFFFLKAFLTLFRLWFLNIFIFSELTIQLILIPHEVIIAFIADKWTTCFAMDIIIEH